MAEPKPIITTVEEAVCDNCIWYGEMCNHSYGSWNVDSEPTLHFCPYGLWLFDIPGDEYLSNTYPQNLPAIHSLLRIKARKACKGDREEE